VKVGDLQLQRSMQPLKPRDLHALHGERSGAIQKGGNIKSPDFEKVLQTTLERQTPLKFSAHAIQRLEDRQIQISAANLDRLERGVREVAEKGGRSSLILMDEQAYLVNIPNRTVITAMSNAMEQRRVFTNVDSVAIV